MRMLVHVKMPHEPFNTAVRNGTVGKTIQRILDEIKPESVNFTEYNGRRGAFMIVDVADPSKVPLIAEPWFLLFNADVEFHVVMSPEDLGRAGLDALGKKWA
jgi:hypothetical protein